jgi:cell division septal protein FtsQ
MSKKSRKKRAQRSQAHKKASAKSQPKQASVAKWLWIAVGALLLLAMTCIMSNSMARSTIRLEGTSTWPVL